MTTAILSQGKRKAKAVVKTGLLLEDWYSRAYAVPARRAVEVAKHYIEEGAPAGYRPNPLFNPEYYAEQTGIKDPVEALLHFDSIGWKEGRDPSRSFLVTPYLEAYPDIKASGMNPLSHYLRYGRTEGRRAFSLRVEGVWHFTEQEMALPEDGKIRASRRSEAAEVSACPLFDEPFYLAQYGLLLDERSLADPALHYTLVGERLGLCPNPFFDPEFYGKQRRAPRRRSLLLHYRRKGWRMGLNPSAEFDGNAYREAYAGKIDGDVCPLEHYFATGRRDGYARIPVQLSNRAESPEAEKAILREMVAVASTGLFDAAWYERSNSDLRDYRISALEHFVRFGVNEDRSPCAHFHVNWYRTCYGRYVGDMNPLLYYAREGYKDCHWPSVDFSPELYFLINRDLKKGRDDALLHYLTTARYRPRRWPNPEDLDETGRAYLAMSADERHALVDAIARSGLFDPEWYSHEYGNELMPGADYIEHYLIYGGAFDYKPNRYFDTGWYRTEYSDSFDDRHPVVFFAETGWRLGHDPCEEFSEEAYRKLHTDLEDLQASMLAHYLHMGKAEGRELPDPGFERESRRLKAEDGEDYLSAAMRSMTAFDARALKPVQASFNKAQMDIHWVIPDFSPGGGGHMTIFRMVSYLERLGHKLTLWVHCPTQHRRPEQARETIQKHFQFVRADVRFVDQSFPTAAKGDVLIATDCWSVWPILSAAKFLSRFYFVQDFEPSFFPMGGRYLAAELTYKQDLHCICASPWLAEKLNRDYGRDTSYFYLAADQKTYFPPREKPARTESLVHAKALRIAFYSRITTDRRAVELGLLALEVLARDGVKIHVDFFGNDMPFADAPFDFTDHGVASTAELAALFRAADIGVVFSATNYSLVPQEMMASGLPIVELDGENTRAIYPENVVTWAKPDPVAIAAAIKSLLDDTRARAQADAALEWVSDFSWEKAGAVVEQTLADVAEKAARARGIAVLNEPVHHKGIKASVVIPTYNAGPQFAGVLDAVLAQHTPWPFEVLVIDSGSTDGTLDIVKARPSVRLHQIDKKDFNHGDTRNLGAEITSGDYIAFLTHDALPANQAWLFNLVEAIDAEPKAMGAFGRHYAYPDASPFTKRDLDGHFKNFLAHPLLVSRDTNPVRYKSEDKGWRQFLHFYSDNNSCFRRSAWEKIPYRRVVFGEDQLWAHDIIEAGYAKMYAAQAIVYHSHDFDAEETEERSAIEASFFKHFFGYDLVSDEAELQRHLQGMNEHDEAWGVTHRVPMSEIDERKVLNEARLRGFMRGTNADTDAIFEGK